MEDWCTWLHATNCYTAQASLLVELVAKRGQHVAQQTTLWPCGNLSFQPSRLEHACFCFHPKSSLPAAGLLSATSVASLPADA